MFMFNFKRFGHSGKEAIGWTTGQCWGKKRGYLSPIGRSRHIYVSKFVQTPDLKWVYDIVHAFNILILFWKKKRKRLRWETKGGKVPHTQNTLHTATQQKKKKQSEILIQVWNNIQLKTPYIFHDIRQMQLKMLQSYNRS